VVFALSLKAQTKAEVTRMKEEVVRTSKFRIRINQEPRKAGRKLTGDKTKNGGAVLVVITKT